MTWTVLDNLETVTVRVHTLNIEPFKIQNLTSAIWIRYTYMMVNCKFGRAGQFGYLATGRVNIRIHRDITGEMWFGVEMNSYFNNTNLLIQLSSNCQVNTLEHP